MSLSPAGRPSVNRQQRAVINHILDHHVTVVSAGAGSGKTSTTVAAVLELLARGLTTIDRFVLITFTVKAAGELRERIEMAITHAIAAAATAESRVFWEGQQERLSAAYIGTIHGFCAGLLRSHGYTERVARESSVTFAGYLLTNALLDTLDASLRNGGASLLDPPLTWNEWELRGEAAAVLNQIRNRGLGPDVILTRTDAQPDDPGKPYRVRFARFVNNVENRYGELKRDGQRLDPADLLAHTARMLTGPAGAMVARQVGERRDYLFIDEFQDTDSTQKQIVDGLVPALDGVLVVGDRKQSIYGFRAAEPSLMDELAGEYHAPVLPLNIAYRPTRQLLDTQNALFAAMSDRYPELGEPLESFDGIVEARSSIPPLTLVSAPYKGGIDQVADELQQLLAQAIDGDEGLRPVRQGDIAILVRANWMVQQYARGLQQRLSDTSIVVQADTGGHFYTRPEIVATYHMLHALLLYPDDAVLSAALRTPYLRNVDLSGDEQYLIQYRVTEGTPLTDQFESAYPEQAAALDDLRRAVRSDTVPQILARLYRRFDIAGYYAGSPHTLANLEKLRELARDMFASEQALTLRQFVARLQQNILTEKDEPDAEDEAGEAEVPSHIRIMTIHRSKGLEFPVVIIPEVAMPLRRAGQQPSFVISDDGLDIGLPAGAFDTRSSRFGAELARQQQDSLHEEMRLLYVGVTRARNAVILAGGDHGRARPPENGMYSWRDEILRAEPRLIPLGARYL